MAREGTSRVPRTHVERIGGDNVKLGQWVASLRDPERRGRLTKLKLHSWRRFLIGLGIRTKMSFKSI